MSQTDQRGLLLATMEPPPTLEEEFQDWYDTEHFPERAGCPGFLTAQRFICIDGWPRYLALYDLQDVQVLHGPDYAKFAGARYSPWTHRIMSRVWGQYRAAGVQLFPGQALLGDKGAASRILLCRFRQVSGDLSGAILQGLQQSFGEGSGSVQFRLYGAKQPDGNDYIAIIELRNSQAGHALDSAAFGSAARYLDMINTYVPYSRRMAGSFPKQT